MNNPIKGISHGSDSWFSFNVRKGKDVRSSLCLKRLGNLRTQFSMHGTRPKRSRGIVGKDQFHLAHQPAPRHRERENAQRRNDDEYHEWLMKVSRCLFVLFSWLIWSFLVVLCLCAVRRFQLFFVCSTRPKLVRVQRSTIVTSFNQIMIEHLSLNSTLYWSSRDLKLCMNLPESFPDPSHGIKRRISEHNLNLSPSQEIHKINHSAQTLSPSPYHHHSASWSVKSSDLGHLVPLSSSCPVAIESKLKT